jgi:uncharacterized protein (TIGR03435 family)
LRDATMVDLISLSYKVDPVNVIGGPSWLEFDRLDIYARAPRTTTRDTTQLMLQSLLVNRFQLKIHPDIRSQPAYVLTIGKAPKLTASDGSGDSGCQFRPPPNNATPEERAVVNFACHNITMEYFATFLHNVEGSQPPRPVVDSTGLKGSWDFDLHWTFGSSPSNPVGQTLADALDKQLGLKFELKSAPLPVVVVNSINEIPTPNSPDLLAKLPPPPPAEFEVAVIRPSDPKEKHFGISTDGSGKINIQHASVETLIDYAWDIDKMTILRGSNVIDQEFYDVVGKATTDASPGGPGSRPPVDPNDLREMLRTLLADRFHLKVHTEDHPFDAYTLFASAAARMKKADPSSRTYCKPGVEPGAKDPRLTNPTITRELVCQNISMAQFTANLRTYAPGNIKTLVLDSTGLIGGYDFAMYWSGENDGYTGLPTADANGDPNGAIPLTDAFSKQLGLRLEKVNRPVQMLVIDHVDRIPTEN